MNHEDPGADLIHDLREMSKNVLLVGMVLAGIFGLTLHETRFPSWLEYFSGLHGNYFGVLVLYGMMVLGSSLKSQAVHFRSLWGKDDIFPFPGSAALFVSIITTKCIWVIGFFLRNDPTLPIGWLAKVACGFNVMFIISPIIVLWRVPAPLSSRLQLMYLWMLPMLICPVVALLGVETAIHWLMWEGLAMSIVVTICMTISAIKELLQRVSNGEYATVTEPPPPPG